MMDKIEVIVLVYDKEVLKEMRPCPGPREFSDIYDSYRKKYGNWATIIVSFLPIQDS